MKPLQQLMILGTLCTLVLAVLGAAPGPGAYEPTQEADGVAELELLLSTNESLRPDRKAKTLLVREFTVAPGAIRLDRAATGVDSLLRDLRQRMESCLVEFGKFRVLSEVRPNETKGASEPPSDAPLTPERNSASGAELAVSCSIEQLNVNTVSEVVKLTGYVSRERTADVELQLTVHSEASGAIVWRTSFTQDYEWTPEQLRAENPTLDSGTLARALLFDATGALARDLTLFYFPTRVIKIEPGAPGGMTFHLNAGRSLHGIGDKFELIRKGEVLTDPDTGSPLGHIEHPMGVLRIVSQDAQTSRAVLIGATDAQQNVFAAGSFDLGTLDCKPIPKR